MAAAQAPPKGQPAPPPGQAENEAAHRAEIVSLCWQHIDEVEGLDRARFARGGGAGAAAFRRPGPSEGGAGGGGGGGGAGGAGPSGGGGARGELLGGKAAPAGKATLPAGGGGGGGGPMLPDDPTASQLPDIDVEETMSQIQKKNVHIVSPRALCALRRSLTGGVRGRRTKNSTRYLGA